MAQDWNSVSLEELLEALREVDPHVVHNIALTLSRTQVDWSYPRPLTEFILAPNAFMIPKTGSKLSSRLKNNLYYYRSNYLLLFLLSFTVCFMRNPFALLALLVFTAGLLCLNDPTAIAAKWVRECFVDLHCPLDSPRSLCRAIYEQRTSAEVDQEGAR